MKASYGKKPPEDDTVLATCGPKVSFYWTLPQSLLEVKTFSLSHIYPTLLDVKSDFISPFHTILHSTRYGRFLRRVLLGSERQRGWGDL